MKQWIKVAQTDDFVNNAGRCVRHGELQIAIFNINQSDWYAVQNLCPHTEQMVLSRGLVGDKDGQPKVACPLHKHNFSLSDGRHLGGQAEYDLTTYPVKVAQEAVYLELEV